MTVIVENGTIVTNANSYASEAELTAYSTARGVTIGAGVLEQYLILAMDYLENLNFKGMKSTADQSLQWPRLYVMIDGYEVDTDVIPVILKNAQMQIAVASFQGNSPIAVIPRATKREKVGDLEVEYQTGSSATPIDPAVSIMLWKLVKGGGTGNIVTVDKA